MGVMTVCLFIPRTATAHIYRFTDRDKKKWVAHYSYS
ncbi:unnamed protein product [Nyctereutes procyonoides]|uniref:(raccoon dog) hypothetical protein n=2 Tax=Nyctereutes procyonoides TaxID=34880 RepID=A0A811XTT2_NYCPR|nr:unnamed protein product [Nyctereutes procyonoides]